MFLKMKTKNTMKKNYYDMPNGYMETIQRGITAVRSFHSVVSRGTGTREENLRRLKKEIETSDAIVVGAGAGLSTAAGFIYTGERFEKWFPDFIRTYGIRDMYSGGFYSYPQKEIFWAYWARYIYINRYLTPPKNSYENLLSLIGGKNHFVITTNVDHCFQRAGFDKKRLFYTQGDYGLFQSTNPRTQKTYDNEEWVMRAMEAQGFVKNDAGEFEMPEDGGLLMEIPTDLLPKCPDDGADMTMNLRSDDSFVENEGWHIASAAYSDFLRAHEGKHILFLELGIGSNTPVICKYPFWQMTNDNKNAVYACLNYNEAFCPSQIEDRSIVIDGDCDEILRILLRMPRDI